MDDDSVGLCAVACAAIEISQIPPSQARRNRISSGARDRECIMGNRLYVGNLSFNSTQDMLRDAFAAHGEVVDVHLVADRMTGQSRGFGFVTMGSRSEAEGAMSAMNGADLDGRALRVNEAEERSAGGGGGGGRGGGGGGRSGGGGGGRSHGW